MTQLEQIIAAVPAGGVIDLYGYDDKTEPLILELRERVIEVRQILTDDPSLIGRQIAGVPIRKGPADWWGKSWSRVQNFDHTQIGAYANAHRKA